MIAKAKKSNIKIICLNAVVLVLSIFLVFVSGNFSKDSGLEKISNYTAQVVRNNTANKKYCAVTIQSKKNGERIRNSYEEFTNLYGVFKQRKVTFASAMNLYNNETGQKDHDIRIMSNGQAVSDSLSLYYLGPSGSVPYNGHFKHYTYPVETMFQDDGNKESILKTRYLAYISQNHADSLLDGYGFERGEDGHHNEEQYKLLLNDVDKRIVKIKFDSDSHDFVILNIYYQTNYYYEGVSEILGDFIATSYYTPLDLRSEQKNIYYMSDYSYQNRYFMQYINSNYSSKNFNVQVNHSNIVGSVDDDYLTSFYYGDLGATNAWLSITFLMLSILGVLVSLLITLKNNFCYSWQSLLFLIVLFFAPYSIFLFLYHCFGFVSFFTHFSCVSFFAIFLVWLFTIFIFKFVIKPRIKSKQKVGVFYYEVTV